MGTPEMDTEGTANAETQSAQRLAEKSKAEKL